MGTKKILKPYDKIGEINTDMILSHPYFRKLSDNELADTIEYMEYESYKKLFGDFENGDYDNFINDSIKHLKKLWYDE